MGEADMIRSMEGFTFDSELNLSMGYYHIKLNDDAQKLCIGMDHQYSVIEYLVL
jgi:hypothetical protein